MSVDTTVVLNQNDESPSYEVIIGMKNSVKVVANGAAGTTLEAVIKAALKELGISNAEANIFKPDGGLNQSVFVDGGRVSDTSMPVSNGSRIHVDQRKENG